ncbi:MAG: hypothetical protein ABIH00_01830, partial [Armatimonadota bacterium]
MSLNPIDIYNTTLKRVPAYKKFLKNKSKRIPRIKDMNDFKKLPVTSKKDYILKHDLTDLCIDGTLSGKHFIYSSSGTTSEPVYWPKLPEEEKNLPYWLGLGLEEAHNISKKDTLIIVGLGLGSWVSGEQTSWAMRSLALSGKNITVITPGSKQDEIINIMKRFAPSFSQTLLISYPPFTKEVLEKAKDMKLPLKKYNLKLGLVGESYSEHFREYAGRLLGHKKEDIMAVWSGYGSADFGAVGRETPLTIIIRKLLYKKNICKKIFGQDQIPALCQYDPSSLYLETLKDELLITRSQA